MLGNPVAVSDTEGSLAQHFVARRMDGAAQWDPQSYIQGTLLQYAWAFSTMLTGKVHGAQGMFKLSEDTQASLITLLR